MLRRRSVIDDQGSESRRPQPDIATLGARALLARWPLHAVIDPPFGQTPHLLIAGSAAPASAFLDQALQVIQYGNATPAVTWLCEDPEHRRRDFLARYPHVSAVVDMRFAALDAPPPVAGALPVTLALVCLDDPPSAWRLAERLAHAIAQLQHVSPLILVEQGADADFDSLSAAWDGRIRAVSYVREAQGGGAWLDHVGDDIAHTIHNHYRDTFAALGGDPETMPSLQDWSSLPDTYRQASRHQADHLWAKLALIDCLAVPDDRVEFFAFGSLEVERLSIVEHQRWAAERYLDGWTHGFERDNALKRHPDLVPYAALSEAAKDKDRFAVRNVAPLLAESKLGIVRLLIVGLDEAPDLDLSASDGRRLARELFERLVARYPDRLPVLATTLRDSASRRLVRYGLEQAGARLFWLLPEVITEMLAGRRDDAERRELLTLAAWAERRIQLHGEEERQRWLRDRAEIRVCLGGEPSVPESQKSVIRRPESNRLLWNFEY